MRKFSKWRPTNRLRNRSSIGPAVSKIAVQIEPIPNTSKDYRELLLCVDRCGNVTVRLASRRRVDDVLCLQGRRVRRGGARKTGAVTRERVSHSAVITLSKYRGKQPSRYSNHYPQQIPQSSPSVDTPSKHLE